MSLDDTDTLSTYKIGNRVISDGFIGTVQYVGSVDGQKGTWIGIEWDDVSRGKHDGTVSGKRYFKASHPTGASFVRPKKLDPGQDFISAVEDKYGPFQSDEDSMSGISGSTPSHDLLVLNMKATKAIAVDFVGGDRVAKVSSLWSTFTRLVLDRHRVNGIDLVGGDPEKLAAFPMVSTCLLRANLLASWQQVTDICTILPLVRNLDVSENRLCPPENADLVKHTDSLWEIESLVMHRLDYSWNDILLVLPLFPDLLSLGASFNKITDFLPAANKITEPILSNLTLLDLVGNPLKSWDEILKLGFMMNLDELHLDECEMTEIFFPDAKPTGTTSNFPSLRHLTIDFNKIDKWRSVSELAKLPELREVRLRHNPFYHAEGITPETARQLVVARLVCVEHLNGSPITAGERRGSEVDYITHLAKEFAKASKSNQVDEFERDHPTFEQLIDKYKLRDELLSEQALAEPTNAMFINVGFIKHGSSDPPVIKKISVNVTIGKLKIFAKRVLILPQAPTDLKLSYQSLKHPNFLASLDRDSKEVYFYSIENGDTVVVEVEGEPRKD